MSMATKYVVLVLVSSGVFASGVARAAEPPSKESPRNCRLCAPYSERQLSVMAGMAQWLLLRGGNVAFEYKTRHFAFEVSHGQGLDLNQFGGFFLTSAERDAGAKLRTPWTTGFGLGYRVTENLHVLIEFKAHHYEVLTRDRADRASYDTFSVGPGAFYSVYLYEGLFLQPNVRWWPNVGSTLAHDRVRLTQADGSVFEHRAHDFGLFANMNVGYTF